MRISIADAAAELGCSAGFLYGAARRREIPVVRFGRRILIDQADMPAILAHFKDSGLEASA
ncbi:MAG TPA: helix-turn-helix domain-containing protein [Spirochaetia bacterium]|nr:helix-turn-helix domain-containing protein [Spirochaetia bacterium]